MRKYINNLKQKPEHTRNKIALIASCGCMVVIVAIWLMTFSIRFSGLLVLTKQANADDNLIDSSQTAGAASPFDALKNNLSNTFYNSADTNTSNSTNYQDTYSNNSGVEINSVSNENDIQQNQVIITDPTQAYTY